VNATSGEPEPSRSRTLADLAAARDAAAMLGAPDGPAEPNSTEPEPAQPPTGSSCLLVLGVLGCLVVAVLAGVSGSIATSLVALLALGCAAALVVRLFRRAGPLGRVAVVTLGAFVLLVAGLALGIQSYDERYFGDAAEREFWDAVSLVSFLLMVVGAVATALGLLALLVGAVVRSVRG
jgi:hypothetical protein